MDNHKLQKRFLSPHFAMVFPPSAWIEKKNTVVAGDRRGGVTRGSFPDLSETSL